MAPDLLEQLARMDVPPPPEQFDAQLHERVNRSLVTSQIVDLVASGMPWALWQFARALWGLVVFTVSGRYEENTKDHGR